MLSAPTDTPDVVHVVVPSTLNAHLDAAAVRLGYLYPSIEFRIVIDGIEAQGIVRDVVALRREVLHAVYRERIFERTLPLRRSLIEGLLGS